MRRTSHTRELAGSQQRFPIMNLIQHRWKEQHGVGNRLTALFQIPQDYLILNRSPLCGDTQSKQMYEWTVWSGRWVLKTVVLGPDLLAGFPVKI